MPTLGVAELSWVILYEENFITYLESTCLNFHFSKPLAVGLLVVRLVWGTTVVVLSGFVSTSSSELLICCCTVISGRSKPVSTGLRTSSLSQVLNLVDRVSVTSC